MTGFRDRRRTHPRRVRWQDGGLLAASPGALGGIRCLPHLRLLLSNLGVTVSPAQLALGHAGQAFSRDGDLADANQQAALDKLVADLIRLTAAVKA